MAAQTGRTTGNWFKLQLEDNGGTLRDLAVNSIGGVGISYEELDMTALQDALKGVLSGHGSVGLEISGPWSNAAAAAASASAARPVLSGAHSILEPLNGVMTPLGFGAYVGVRHDWETGEPVFGLSSSAANGVIVTSYVSDLASMIYTASIRMYPASAAPAWGTAAIT